MKCARFLLVSLAGVMLAACASAQESRKNAPATLNDTSLEVVALESLHQFQFTPAQMRTLRRLAKETAMEPGARETVKVSDGFRKTLLDLRNALADASNAERIQQLQEKIDKLRAEEKVDLDDAVQITEAATRRAPEIFKLLSARQVAGYIALYADDFPDPLEILRAALPRVRGFNAKEWEAIREDVSEEIGRLVGSVTLPVNVLSVRGAPPVSELAALGVARVSVGGAFAFNALGALVEAATELRDSGTYGFLERAAGGGRAARSAFS